VRLKGSPGNISTILRYLQNHLDCIVEREKRANVNLQRPGINYDSVEEVLFVILDA